MRNDHFVNPVIKVSVCLIKLIIKKLRKKSQFTKNLLDNQASFFLNVSNKPSDVDYSECIDKHCEEACFIAEYRQDEQQQGSIGGGGGL